VTTDDGTPVDTSVASEAGNRLLAQLEPQLAGITLPGGIELPDTFVPGSGNLDLGDLGGLLELPENPNPQQVCSFLAGGLTVPDDQVEALSQAFVDLCGQLPAAGALDLDQLLGDLLDVLRGLLDALPDAPVDPGTIPNEAPHYVPANYWGYWHKQYDVDCPELTYDEANAILAWDRSDPFRLDRDNDGEACEANAHGDDVEYVEYIGYPVGGVATGDGSTGSGASGVEVALAAGMLSGLGVTGLALVRRFARQG
jgi:hypothetical protein